MNQGPYNPYTPPGPGMAPPGPPMQQPQGYGYDYEFNDNENAIIAGAAFWARLLGIFMIVTGAASLLNCNIVTFAIDLAVGITLIGGASSLKMVVDTQGNDIAHMMMALSKLKTVFKIRVIVVIVAVAILMLLFALILLLALASAPRH